MFWPILCTRSLLVLILFTRNDNKQFYIQMNFAAPLQCRAKARSSLQWWGPFDDHTYFTRSAFTYLGLWQKLYDRSLHHLTMTSTFLSTSNRLAEICKGEFRHPVFGVRGDVGGWAYLTVRPWVPISSQLKHMIYLAPFWSYLAGSKSVSTRPSDQDTMTNTAL